MSTLKIVDDELKRLEDQIYEYYPHLQLNNADLKRKRRERLLQQLQNSDPLVLLSQFDAYSSLNNIKHLLEKFKNNMSDSPVTIGKLMTTSESRQHLQPSDDELIEIGGQHQKLTRRSASIISTQNEDFVDPQIERKGDSSFSQLCLTVLIPKVLLRSGVQSVDLKFESSQQPFRREVKTLLENSLPSNINKTSCIKSKKISKSSNKHKSQPPLKKISSVNSLQLDKESQNLEDDTLSHLISQVLSGDDVETVLASSQSHNDNYSESQRFNTCFTPELARERIPNGEPKKKRSKQREEVLTKGLPKKRGRKPKCKPVNRNILDNGEPKSDLVKYLEFFSNTCNATGSMTPVASSTMSQQLVTSTTHNLDQDGVTYYIEAPDWVNSATSQLVPSSNVAINGEQDEFNVTELVNYIDNVGDASNVIASVLDAPAIFPVAEIQVDHLTPPPAHICEGALDLSKKVVLQSSMENTEDCRPVDLSMKSIHTKTALTPLEKVTLFTQDQATADVVFIEKGYNSFEKALDMPLIDVDDHMNAFMEMTKNNVPAMTTFSTAESISVTSRSGSNGITNVSNLPKDLFEEESGNEVENPGSSDEVTSTNVNFYEKNSSIDCVKENYNKIVHTINEKNFRTENGKEKSGNLLCESKKEVEGQNYCTNDLVEDNFIKLGNKNINYNIAEECEIVSQSSKETISPKELNEHVVDERIVTIEKYHNEKEGFITVQNMENQDDLYCNDSDISSVDLLFVDVDLVTPNRFSCGSNIGTDPLAKMDCEDDHCSLYKQIDVTKADKDNEKQNDSLNSIDLVEETPHINVNLQMPQLTLLENNSEEFTSLHFNNDYEYHLDSSEKINITIGNSKSEIEIKEVKSHDIDENVTSESMVSLIEDESTGNRKLNNTSSVELQTSIIEPPSSEGNAASHMEIETEDENQNFKNNTCNLDSNFGSPCKKREAYGCITSQTLMHSSVNSTQKLGHKNIAETLNKIPVQNQRLETNFAAEKIKSEEFLPSLSLLEQESKLDNVCFDFGDEIEDDALSLATSCFNSDEEDSKECKKSPVTASFCKVEKSEISTTTDRKLLKNNDNALLNSTCYTETEETSFDSTKKYFKIPKLSSTSVKEKSSNITVVTEPLPMVKIPRNILTSAIKLDDTFDKQINLEKITRTVQNICAVSPLQSSQPTTSVSAISPSTKDLVLPKVQEILQCQNSLQSSESLKDVIPNINDIQFRNGLHLPESLKDVKPNDLDVNKLKSSFSRGVLAGKGGEGREHGISKIEIAKTFGVTCFPFLSGKCRNPACYYSHTCRDSNSVRNTLEYMTEEDLNASYRFMYNHRYLFCLYMKEFCTVYAQKNKREKLLNMVRDCERYNGCSELIRNVFDALIRCGLSKVNACRQILSHSYDRSQETVEILVNMIIDADWIMFSDYMEEFTNIPSYHFRIGVLHQMAPTILKINNQQLASVFFKCLVNIKPEDLLLVQHSPVLLQLLEQIKNSQMC